MRYSDLASLGIDLAALTFAPMPDPGPRTPEPAVALHYGWPEEQIDFTLRG